MEYHWGKLISKVNVIQMRRQGRLYETSHLKRIKEDETVIKQTIK